MSSSSASSASSAYSASSSSSASASSASSSSSSASLMPLETMDMNRKAFPLEMLNRLQGYYLPELIQLSRDCTWVKQKLGLDSKKELLPSESKLVQFIGIVDLVISKIQSYHPGNVHHDRGTGLYSLETKICKSILPVKAKLLGKLSCLQEQSSSLEIPSYIVNDIAANNTAIKSADILSSKTNNTNNCAVASVSSTSSSSSSTPSSPPQSSSSSSNCSLPRNDSFAMIRDQLALDSSSNYLNSQVYNSQTLINDQSNTSFEGIAYTFEVDGFVTYTTGDNIYVNNAYGNNADKNVNENKSISNTTNIVNDSSTSGSSNNSHCGKRKFEGKNRENTQATKDRVVLSEVKNEETLAQSDEFMSSRRRRRLSQIVPNPRKPRQADYICSVCNECYTFTVLENPWWAVYEHECPRCQAIQIPRIDINIQANAIELDPNVVALYGEGVDDSGDENCDNEEELEDVEEQRQKEETVAVTVNDNAELASDANLFDGEGLLKAEEASKLLVLMCHARTCTGDHSLPKHNEICKSTKFLMLHIRDCDGTDVHGRECQFPWCSPCKRLLVHLTRCIDPKNCKVCNPWTLSQCYQQLHHLNKVRLFDEPQSTSSNVNSLNQSSKVHT